MTLQHHPSGSLSQPRRWLGIAILAIALLLLAGCAETGQMIDQPRYDPLEASDFFPNGQSARPWEEGTVPYYGAISANSPVLTGQNENGQPYQGFPVPVTTQLVERGQERFNIYCTPCHGATGEGNGMVTNFGFPKPPSLLGDNAKALSNGEIFNIITNGRGNMFPYGYRVKAADRWAVISYLRAMQLKNGAVSPADLTPDELNQLGVQP